MKTNIEHRQRKKMLSGGRIQWVGGVGGGGGVVYRTATLTSGAFRVGSASFCFSVTHVHAAPVGPSVRPPPLSP